MTYVMAIDQGTTSSRAVLFDGAQNLVEIAQEEFPQIYPQPGWVEHDPETIWDTTLRACQTLAQRVGADQIATIGITNQRETTVVWDKDTGAPIHNAIVWQDRRTAELCDTLKAQGHEDTVRATTGLLLDPYFSATKLKWILDNVEGARAKASAGQLLFGTIDCYLIWKLTGGASHITDATNAARTLLYDIHNAQWSPQMCALFDIPIEMLPEVKDCAAEFGATVPELMGRPIPIQGVAGDQQAATLGQACFEPGMLKATYGTGCFALLNTGETAVTSNTKMLTTIAYQLDGTPTYALEGSIFIAGAVVQWLRDGLQIIDDAKQTQSMSERSDMDQEVVLVPAFTGLGAPYWKPECRGAIFGLTRNSGPNELARAALESVGYQTRDLLDAMKEDWGQTGADAVLRVDGGMSASNWTMQFLSDILNAPVDRPKVIETTALGAAWLAGMQAGIWPNMETFKATWALDQSFTPQMDAPTRDHKYGVWKDAIARLIGA